MAATTTVISGVAAPGLAVVPNTANELLRNELIIGGGIALLGGVIGLGYGLWKNSRAKNTGFTDAVKTDLWAAFEGAIVGIIIALIAILLYRSFFHGQALYNQARVQQEEALARAQQARLQNFANAAPAVVVATPAAVSVPAVAAAVAPAVVPVAAVRQAPAVVPVRTTA